MRKILSIKNQNKNMKKYIIFSALLLTILQIHSQSYEGYIGENIPVWLEINESNTDNTTGSYFYKKNGGIIPLSVLVKGNNITLNEKNKTGEISGVFACVKFSDSLIGSWKNTKTNKSLPVKLYNVNPSFKVFSKIPSADKLTLSNGQTLMKELTDNIDEAGKKPKINFNYAEKSIISTNFYWEAMGAYSSGGTINHNFNLTNNKEIILIEEINPTQLLQFKEILKIQLQIKVDNYRKEFSDEQWIEAFGDKETYQTSFKVKEIEDRVLNNNYFKRGFVLISIDGFFGFPHVIQGMDLFTELEISFTELNLYLKSNSILGNLK
jgi:hypothetical protein